MAGKARLRGRRPAQEAHMRPRRCHGKKKGAAAPFFAQKKKRRP